MKFLSIASLALVLALSGCSSSPSIEEQTKLIEYENCLEQARTKANTSSDDFNRGIISLEEAQNRSTTDYPERYCAKKRP